MVNLIDKFEMDVNDDCLGNKLSTKLSAINNDVRFTILEILRNYHEFHDIKNENPLYSREINLFLTNYNIIISPQMLGQHLKILVEAGLLDEVVIKKEIPNKIGRRNVKSYILKNNAFEDLFLEIDFLSDELLSFFGLYEVNRKEVHGDCCVLTIFNGKDKGKTFKIHKNDIALIGRELVNDNLDYMEIDLDNSYYGVSKHHLKLFYDGGWCVVDECSSNGTFVDSNLIPFGVKTKLKNNSFIKLSKGDGGVVFYCSF